MRGVQRLSPPTSPSSQSPASPRSSRLAADAPDAQVTITRVTMQPGATSQRHSHPKSEQTWIVEQGTAMLLLADGKTDLIRAGDVVRTPAGEVYGVMNSGNELFIYMAVTVRRGWNLDLLLRSQPDARHIH